MKRYRKVIFVGSDNLCESIMAEAVLKKVAENRPLEVISRGLVVLFPEPVNSKAAEVLEDNQLQASKAYSEELVKEDITEDTLIFTMTEAQAQKVVSMYQDACDVAVLREFVGAKGDTVTPTGEIANYQAAFEHLDLLVKAAARLIFEPIDQEFAREQAQSEAVGADVVEQVVQQVFEETVQEILGDEISAAAEEEKKRREQALAEEYQQIVEKTAAREAAREEAARAEVSEYKQLYQEIVKRKNELDGWGEPPEGYVDDDTVDMSDAY